MNEQKTINPREIMEHITVSEQSTRLEKLAKDAAASGYGLNVMLAYEDAETRRWCREVFERAARVAGAQAIRATWWKVSDLNSPGVLDGAVSTAMRADVVVIASRAGQDLPLPFYVWAEAWSSHRVPAAGALVALLAEPSALPGSDKLHHYLSVAAARARMEFVLEQRGGVRRTGTDGPGFGIGDTQFISMAFAV